MIMKLQVYPQKNTRFPQNAIVRPWNLKTNLN